MARIKWCCCRGWCQTTDDELIVLVILITSVGDLLNLFELHCLEYQVSFYSAVTAGLFLSLQSFVFFFIINTNLFGKPFCCSLLCLFLCHRCLCITRIEIYQVDCKESVHQLNKVVKSVCTVSKWILYLRNNKVNKQLL